MISGIDDGLKALGRREGTNLLVVAGDGGTADIGLSALSGAIERNQDFIYLCYDNESYMNTGGQRSGTTSFGARGGFERLRRRSGRRPKLSKPFSDIAPQTPMAIASRKIMRATHHQPPVASQMM